MEKVTTIQVSVGNGRHYGGGMTVEQTAAVDDGKLDFYSLEIAHWWRLLALLPALRRGTHGKAADVRAFHTREIRLTTRKPRPVNTDGELTHPHPGPFQGRAEDPADLRAAPRRAGRPLGSGLAREPHPGNDAAPVGGAGSASRFDPACPLPPPPARGDTPGDLSRRPPAGSPPAGPERGRRGPGGTGSA